MNEDNFDEDHYLERYPDIAKAVRKGAFRSGKHHYNLVGRSEGRIAQRPLHASDEMNIKIGKYTIVNRPYLLSNRLKENHTYIIVGSSRGGTSSIAFAMYHQGIDMGVRNTVNYEDPYFVQSIRQEYFDSDAVNHRIRQRNSEKDVWGMKVPAAAFHLRKLERLVRNPIFIFIYRNPVSVARSILTRTNVFERNPKGMSQALYHSAAFNRSMSDSITDLRSPVICIEYENVLNNTKFALKEFFEELGQPIKYPDLLIEYMSRPGYKNVETKKES